MDDSEIRTIHICAQICRVGSKIIDIVVTIALLLFMLYSGSALWDVYSVYNRADNSAKVFLKYKPPEISADGSNPTLSELQSVNGDVAAWLTIDDTKIDYPVVQGQNNSEYLNKGVDGKFLLSGAIFLDYRNAKDFSDAYSLIYGHHMEHEEMFGGIDYFLKKDYFDTHPTGTLYLPGRTYHIEIFASCSGDAYDSTLFNPGNASADLNSTIAHIKSIAAQWKEPGTAEQIISLATCASVTSSSRTLIFGTLTPISAQTH